MRKLIIAEHISLDGIIQSPGGPDEDPSGDFRLGGWMAPYDDDLIDRFLEDMFSQPFELLLGRRTYDIWASYWPHIGAESPSHPIADLFNRVPKHVATHRPDSLDWHNSHALEGDLADAVRTLKQRDGADLLTWGSSEIVHQLLAAGFVDELRLMVYPVVLGKGKRLFDDEARATAFTVAQSATTPAGAHIAHYVRDGEVRTGSFDDVESGMDR
jgi:dihydrofolate reductase